MFKPAPLPITPWMEWVLWKYSTRTSPLQHSWSTLLFSRSARYYTSMSWSTLCFPEVLSITLLWVEAPFVFQKCWVSHFYEQFFVSLPLKCRTAVTKIETSLSEDDERSGTWLKRHLIWPRVSFFGSNIASPKKSDKSDLWDQTAVENASDLCFRFRGKVNQIFGADKAC